MVWKCFPLNLHNWSNSWKWKEEMNANELADELDYHWDRGPEKAKITTTMLRQQQEQIKEKDVCLKLLHDRIAHLNKMVVYYQDISMSGTHSEEYENGFWDAVDFVKEKQRG